MSIVWNEVDVFQEIRLKINRNARFLGDLFKSTFPVNSPVTKIIKQRNVLRTTLQNDLSRKLQKKKTQERVKENISKYAVYLPTSSLLNSAIMLK